MQPALQTEKNDDAAPPRLADYDYSLPAELIAQEPPADRDGARLLVMDRTTGGLRHREIRSLPDLLVAGDLLVFNRARVRPARLFGRHAGNAAVELLVVRAQADGSWYCLGRPAKRLRAESVLAFGDGVSAQVEAVIGGGRYAVRFDCADVPALLERHGEIPLPPYIKRPDGPLPFDADRYQTVFAAAAGAVAAPTAGLHFTPELLERLRERGVDLAWLTLDVGPATFLPLRDETIGAGLEPEGAEIPRATADAVMRARREGRRVIAVGTTTTRALESAWAEEGLVAGARPADLFIAPGHRFRAVDALLTNFHLPRSSLLMLVSALAGRRRMLDAYAEAVAARYRFYSYGDAMLIL